MGPDHSFVLDLFGSSRHFWASGLLSYFNKFWIRHCCCIRRHCNWRAEIAQIHVLRIKWWTRDKMFYIAIALNIHLKEDRKSLPNTCPYIINLYRLTDTSNSVMNDIAVSVLYLTGVWFSRYQKSQRIHASWSFQTFRLSISTRRFEYMFGLNSFWCNRVHIGLREQHSIYDNRQ